MARTMNQQEPDNVKATNPSSCNGNDRAVHSDSSAAQAAVEEAQRWNADISRILTDEQMRELMPNPNVVTTILRLYEDQQNDLANYIVSPIFDVRTMVVNAIDDVVSWLGSSNQSFPLEWSLVVLGLKIDPYEDCPTGRLDVEE